MSVKITDLGNAVLPLAGTEVLELAVSETESRKVTVDNLLGTAPGLDATFVTMTANVGLANERILTAGTNISIVDNGAGNSVVINAAAPPAGNLPVPVTANSMLRSDGVSAWFEAADLTFDPTTAQLTITNAVSSNPALQINLGNNPSTGIVIDSTLASSYVALRMNDQTGGNFFLIRHSYSLSTANHEFLIESSSFGTLIEMENAGEIWIGGGEGGSPFAVLPQVNGRVMVHNDATLYFEEVAAAQADLANHGQLWVRSVSPNELMYTDDAGNDFDLQSTLYFTSTIRAIAGSSGLLVRSDGSTDTELRSINLQHADGTNRAIIRHNSDPDLLIRNQIHGGNLLLEAEDSGGAIRSLVSGDPDDDVKLFDVGVEVARTLPAASGGFEVNNTLTGAGFERVLTTSDAGGGGAPGGVNHDIQFNNAGAFGGDTGFTYDDGNDLVTLSNGANFAELVATGGGQVRVQSEDGGDEAGYFIENADTSAGGGRLVLDNTTGRLSLEQTNDTGTLQDVWINMQRNGAVQLYFNNVQQLTTSADGVVLSVGGASLYIAEKASANADVAGQGQIWVSSVPSPNELYYTDETGNDINLITDLWDNGTLQAQSTSLGLDVRDTLKVGSLGSTTGVLKLGEQANADADEAGYGQFWVRNDAPNFPMFTKDGGQDFQLLPEFIEQSTDDTVNNTTTLANTELTFSNLPAGFYRIDGMFLLRDVAVSGCDARIDCNVSGQDTDSVMRVSNKNFSGAGALTFDEMGLVTDLFDNMTLVNGSGVSRFMVTGYVEFTSGTNSFTVQFAQNTAQVGDLDFQAGSFLSLTKMGQ